MIEQKNELVVLNIADKELVHVMSVKSCNKTRETCNGHGHNDGHKRGLLDK